MIWLKENWKWLLGVISTLGLSVLFARAKQAKANKKLKELEEKKDEVIETAGNIKADGIEKAGKKHSESVKKAHEEAGKKTKDAEQAKEKRKKELLDNPDDIDDELSEFGITEKK
jgi:hypothetical protein